jgi:hypothetical protein
VVREKRAEEAEELRKLREKIPLLTPDFSLSPCLLVPLSGCSAQRGFTKYFLEFPVDGGVDCKQIPVDRRLLLLL